MRAKRTLVAAVVIAALIATTAAHAASDVSGVWWTPDRDGKIAIVTDAAGTASGRLIAVAPEDAGKRDVENPDPALRDRLALGLPILVGFRPAGDGTWTGGTVYDPESGRTYRGTLSLDGDGRLRMRGFVLIELFGRTEILTRVGGPQPETQQPGEPGLVYLCPGGAPGGKFPCGE